MNMKSVNFRIAGCVALLTLLNGFLIVNLFIDLSSLSHLFPIIMGICLCITVIFSFRMSREYDPCDNWDNEFIVIGILLLIICVILLIL